MMLSVVLATMVANAVVMAEPRRGFTVGEEPRILLTGLPPGQMVTLSVAGPYEKWSEGADGRWRPSSAIYRSRADYVVRPDGTIDTAAQAPEKGTYSGVDAYGLFWSMRRPGDAALAGLATQGASGLAGGRWLSVSAGGASLLREPLQFVDPSGLTIETVTDGALNGVFASPAGARRRPAIILLHGSEGGTMDAARAMAVRYAGQGYAAFAFNYFAWDIARVKGVPNIHVNVPIEGLERVRTWLTKRPEADVGRLGLYGHSKGAEYAAVSAVRYPWVKAVVACVPSDSVWEGYGIGDQRSAQPAGFVAPKAISSWAWRSKPVPYIPLKPWSNKPDRGYFDNTGRYENGRRDHPREAAKAAIPVERSNAKWLLLGSMRDETWASGAMAHRLAERLRRAGKGGRVTEQVYEKAGHQICGDGTYSTFVWGDPSTDPRVKEPAAEGAAAADAWRRTKAFLKSAL